MKLTVDSSEPLEDAMPVLGALYGVTLQVSSEAQDVSGPAGMPGKQGRKRGTVTKSRGGTSARRPAAADRQARKSARAAVPDNNAEVRAWARQTGLTVKDRGRVPSSVLIAYREAHQ